MVHQFPWILSFQEKRLGKDIAKKPKLMNASLGKSCLLGVMAITTQNGIYLYCGTIMEPWNHLRIKIWSTHRQITLYIIKKPFRQHWWMSLIFSPVSSLKDKGITNSNEKSNFAVIYVHLPYILTKIMFWTNNNATHTSTLPWHDAFILVLFCIQTLGITNSHRYILQLGHRNKMFHFPLPSLSWRWVGR